MRLTQKKSSAGTLVLIALLGFLLVGGSAAGWMVSEIRELNPFPDKQNELAKELEDQMKNRVQEMAREAQQQMRDEKERAAQKGDALYSSIDSSSGDSSSRTNEFPTALEKYRYPDAEIEQITRVTGNDFIRLTADDNIEYVSDFYKKIIGQPISESKNGKGEKAVFQVPGSPQIVIVITPHDGDPNKARIQILSSSTPRS